MLLIPHGLGAPSQTGHENQPDARSGEASETAFLTVFDGAALQGPEQVGEGLFETMPEAGAPGGPKDVGQAIARPTEGGLESTSTGDMPGDTRVAKKKEAHDHGAPLVEDTVPARIRENPRSPQPSTAYSADPAPIATKAPGRDVELSGSLTQVAPPPATSHRLEMGQDRAWPEDQKLSLNVTKTNKVHQPSAPIDALESGADLRREGPRVAEVKTGQGTVRTTSLVHRFPAPEAGGAVQPVTGQATQADRVVQALPATSLGTNSIVQSAKGAALRSNMETSFKNRGDHPQPRQSVAKSPPQAITLPQTGAMPPPPAVAPMPPPTAPVFKPDLNEEAPRSPVIPDDARAELRLPAEGGPRPAGPLLQSPQSHDLPRHVAQQIVEALQRGAGGKDRGVDLLLNPAELGRVRISLSPGDAGLTVHIIADRPETLDLMRRNIDMLAQDFQGLGYEATDFAFAQHDHEGDDQGRKALQQHIPDVIKTADSPSQVNATIITDRVDIRL